MFGRILSHPLRWNKFKRYHLSTPAHSRRKPASPLKRKEGQREVAYPFRTFGLLRQHSRAHEEATGITPTGSRMHTRVASKAKGVREGRGAPVAT